MASGSSKGFDFASDDILCSYENYTNQEASNGSHSDSEFNKNRMARTSVFPTSSYNPADDSSNEEVIILAVERSMKKHTDNLMRFLEGISSRLSQLELYCYNLDKSIGEMRSDLTRDHEESDAKLKFLEKHVQEVHRSVQILRDKQELADTQKELAKLQLAQKESSSSHSSQQNVNRPSTPDAKENDNSADSHGQQLALALPNQFAPPQPQRIAQPMSQPLAYYPPQHGPTQLNPTQYPQSQLPPPPPPPQQLQQQPPPQQPLPQQPPPQQPLQQQPPPPHQMQTMAPPYPQQWAPQVQPQPSRPSSPQVYPHPQYPEPMPNSMPMHMRYSAGPPPASNQLPTYTYGGPTQTVQPQQPPHHQPPPPAQHLKPAYGQQSDGYTQSGPPQGNAYMMYDNQAGNSHLTQGGYPPNPQHTGPAGAAGGGGGGGGMVSRHVQQSMRNHPYNELVDKLVSMGYRSDHVMSVIQRLDESGQTVDFNAVLDRLNGHPSGW
ncbi:uncharacterized protein [Rutidosis leptorrhynchoides]|uniref:uncharacterized protein isoform X2 n=1 Tax=Rutidosis leptorrhynchoides TaxID=125765 RepID=UPI003A9A5F7F